MLEMRPHPGLRRIEWVSQLVAALRERPRWVLTPQGVRWLDPAGLRRFVEQGHWPARFGQPADLWVIDGEDLLVCADGRSWRRLEQAAGGPDQWYAVRPGDGEPSIVAVPTAAEDPHAVPASG